MSELLPTTNADGLPVVPMTEDQKYIFDLRGWILLPGLIEGDQLAEIQEHQMRFVNDPESLPPEERNSVGGPSQVLLDHPVVVGVLNELVSHQDVATEDCYGFRFERTRTDHRNAAGSRRIAFQETKDARFDNFKPHGGSGFFRFAGNSHIYQMLPGKVHSGLTRVVWDLNEVEPGDGGTLLVSGSHKAAFDRPEFLSDRTHEVWDTYACPAGSALVFTEALTHSGTRWTNPDRDRLSLFNLYNTVNSKWGMNTVPEEVIAAMPPKRQTLFRGVWVGGGKVEPRNMYFNQENVAV